MLLFTIQNRGPRRTCLTSGHRGSVCIQIILKKVHQNVRARTGSAVSDQFVVYSDYREKIASSGCEECLGKRRKLCQSDGFLTDSYFRSLRNNFKNNPPRDAVQDPAVQRGRENVTLGINKKHSKGRTFQNRLLVGRKNKQDFVCILKRHDGLMRQNGPHIVQQFYVRAHPLIREGRQADASFIAIWRGRHEFLYCYVQMGAGAGLLHRASGEASAKNDIYKQVAFDTEIPVLFKKHGQELSELISGERRLHIN